jgi:hypothetical protein
MIYWFQAFLSGVVDVYFSFLLSSPNPLGVLLSKHMARALVHVQTWIAISFRRN